MMLSRLYTRAGLSRSSFRATSVSVTGKGRCRSISLRRGVTSDDHNAHRYNARKGIWLALAASTATMLTTLAVNCDNSSSGASHVPQVVYRRSDISAHSTLESGVWVTYKDGVYDVTQFLANHPGGQEKLLLAAGKDLTELWVQAPHRFHFRSPLALELLEDMRIGTLHADDVIHVDVPSMARSPLRYSNKKIYDCIVIGSGVSGLQCAKALTTVHKIPTSDLLVLEAQDYVGGRVRQMADFIKGVHVDVGAEFLHGSNTLLTKFAEENKEPISELFCWAHGDGGPLPEPVNGGYGLYYIADKNGQRKRLLRFDDQEEKDFVGMNEALWGLAHLKEEDFTDAHSLHDYLSGLGFSEEMLSMAHGGFANTLCTNSKELSLKQCIKWCRLWHGESEEDGDYKFANSFKCVVDKLKENIQIELNSPVRHIQHPQSEADIMGGLIKLTTEQGDVYYARSVVVTSSPHVLKSGLVEFHPPLSPELKEALATTNMFPIYKVFLKFSRPVWPKDLHGMIMTDDNMLFPEMWFYNVADKAAVDEPAKCYVVGFATADYAARIHALPKDQVLTRALGQLEDVFKMLEPKHMMAVLPPNSSTTSRPEDLPRPSEAYLGGMFWDWRPEHHPFIGGGYASPKASTAAHLISLLSKPYGDRIFFAGEATNLPGATAHAALESGLRAADYVANLLTADADSDSRDSTSK